MPSFASIQTRAEALLARGLSPTDARELVKSVTGRTRASAALPLRQREQLARLSELYADKFTGAGAQEWQRLTGIEVSAGEVSYPEGFLPAQSLLSLRTQLGEGASESKRSRGARGNATRVGQSTSMLGLRVSEAARAEGRDPRSTYVIGARSFTGAQIDTMSEQWTAQVVTRQITSKAFRKKHRITHKELYHLRKSFPGEFGGRGRKTAAVFEPKVLAKAEKLIRQYHADEFPRARLVHELNGLGIFPLAYEDLEAQLGGLKISKRASIAYQASRRAFFNGIADSIEALLDKFGWVVRKQTDLVELLNADQGFVAAYGTFTLGRFSKMREQDLAEANGRIDAILERVKPEGKQGRRWPTGVKGSRAPAPAGPGRGNAVRGPDLSATLSQREQLLLLADMLAAFKGKPSPANLKKVLARFAKQHGVERPYRLWRLIMEEHKGVIPEFARWRVGSKNDYDLRYIARWRVAMHEAGPGATRKQVEAKFRESPEFKADGRIPSYDLAYRTQLDPSLNIEMGAQERATLQKCRNMLEAIRIAPPHLTVKEILRTSPIAPVPNYDTARYYLEQILDKGRYRDQLDQRVVKALRAQEGRVRKGQGEAPNPAFDPAAEPANTGFEIAQRILETPRVEDSPMFLHAITRLQGRRSFENSNVMMINHRYSDIVAFTDLMVRAGMSPKNSLFVSTCYPFDPVVSMQLKDLGVDEISYPQLDLKAYLQAVEQGIQRMLDIHDRQEREHGYGRPILILDDGGAAARLIKAKFREHAHKFKVVEITAAGHRIAAELAEENRRIPFVYYSIAYSELKKRITSKFYATRVVDRLRSLLEHTPIKPINDKVAVLGGGPMGRFAAEYMRDLGYDVAIVDPNPEVRKLLQTEAGFRKNQLFTVENNHRALEGRGIVLGMSGHHDVLGPSDLDKLAPGAIVVQGSSKRNEYDMEGFAKAAKSRTAIPRSDGLTQPCFTYHFEGGKELHFLGDGWTLNHDGSLHGTPFEDITLETAVLFESAVEAASDSTASTGEMKVVAKDIQQEYAALWESGRSD